MHRPVSCGCDIREKDMKKDIITRGYRKAKRSWIAGICLLLAAILLFGMGVVHFSRARNNVYHLDDIILSDDNNKTGRIAYLDLYGCYAFASTDSEDYFIAYDDDYYYIITMDDAAYDNAVEIADQSGDGLFRLYGWTTSIPEEAKSFAIDAFNEDAGENYADYSNFEEVFGDVALKVGKESTVFGLSGFFQLSGFYVVGALIALFTGLALFFLGRYNMKSFAPVMDGEDNQLREEIESEDAIWLDGVKTYLTDNYLVSVNGTFSAVKYSDIFWTYLTEHRTNGIRDYDFINAVTNDGKMVNFANSGSFGKKNRQRSKEIHSQILDKIVEKNPSVLVGFSPENQQAYNDLRDRLKEGKNRFPGIE